MKLATDKSFQHSHAKQLAGTPPAPCCIPLLVHPLPVLRFAQQQQKGTSESEKEIKMKMKMKIRPAKGLS